MLEAGGTMKPVLKILTAAILWSSVAAFTQDSSNVILGPKAGAQVKRYAFDPAKGPVLSHEEKLRLVRQHIKHVFVLFQENRAFDFYFSSFPGADGLYSQPSSQVAGFVQPIVNTDGTVGTISPFRIPLTIVDAKGDTVPLYPADIAGINHTQVGIARKLSLDKELVPHNGQTISWDESSEASRPALEGSLRISQRWRLDEDEVMFP
jgi:phospholipase C